MRVTFTPLAEQDLEAIADYIATDNPVRAVTFVRELRAQLRIPRHSATHSTLIRPPNPEAFGRGGRSEATLVFGVNQ